MAEALVFRSEWVIQINDMLYHDGESRLPNEYAILRVAAPLRKVKPEAYIPQFVSMGPYHHSILEKDIDSSCAERKISTAETCKGKAAASLFSSERGKSFKSIVELLEQKRPEIDRFYHWPIITTEDQEHSHNFALMMAVDSSFLLDFLISSISRLDFLISSISRLDFLISSISSLDLDPLQECIKSDILKLENQIPLLVLNVVFEKAKEASIYDGLPEDFNELLQKTCRSLSPFEFVPVSDGNNPREAVKDQQPHLLAYLHAFVSPTLQIERETPTLQIERETQKPTLLQGLKILIHDIPLMLAGFFIPNLFFERKYEMALNAEKLAKAGIKFKSDSTEKIRFDSWSATLYLPRIKVFEMQTEVLLRNMVALEFNDVARGTTVMRYIGLMDSLIQTPDDVRVLRDHHVIATDTVTDESIAKMWNDLAQPFFTGQFNLTPDDGFKSKLFLVLRQRGFKSKLKRMIGGLYDYVSNWKFIGFVAAFLGLFLTAVQTYFTVYPRKN